MLSLLHPLDYGSLSSSEGQEGSKLAAAAWPVRVWLQCWELEFRWPSSHRATHLRAQQQHSSGAL